MSAGQQPTLVHNLGDLVIALPSSALSPTRRGRLCVMVGRPVMSPCLQVRPGGGWAWSRPAEVGEYGEILQRRGELL